MIDTVIQCSKCEELVEVTARSISFPFVCDGCNPKVEEKEMKTEMYGVYDDQDVQEVEPDHELDHDGATVEATTQLIAELESQLEQANADNEGLMADIEFLGELLAYGASVNAFGAKRVLALTAELEESHAWEDLSHQTIARLLKEVSSLTDAVSIREDHIKRQDARIDKAERSLWRKFLDFWATDVPYPGSYGNIGVE